MRTGITVQDVDPTAVVVGVRQYPAPGPFGVVEIAGENFTIQFFAQGPDAALRLQRALRVALAGDVDMRP